jgi:hypothetical protein
MKINPCNFVLFSKRNGGKKVFMLHFEVLAFIN